MNKWHKIVGIIVFAVIGIYELLLWALQLPIGKYTIV